MSKQGLARRVAMMPRAELEELYLAAADENLGLRKETKELRTSLLQLQTKLKRQVKKDDAATGAPRDRSALARRLEDAEHTIRELEMEKTALARKLQREKHKEETVPPRASAYGHVKSKVAGSLRRGGTASSGIRREGSSITSNRELAERAQSEAQELRIHMNELEKQLAQAHDDTRAKERENASLIQQLQVHSSARSQFEESTQRMQSMLHQRGMEENITVIKLRRELSENEKRLAAAQTKCDILSEQLTKAQAKIEESAHELHEKRLEAATLQAKLRDVEVAHRSAAVLTHGTDDHVARIEQLEKENELLTKAHEDISQAALSGERERHHKRQVEALQEKIKQLQNQVRDEMQKSSRLHTQLRDEQNSHTQTEGETRELRRSLMAKMAELDREKEKLGFFISESGQDIKEAEEALVLIRARKEKENAEPDFLRSEKHARSMQKEMQELRVSCAENVHDLIKTRELLAHQEQIALMHKAKSEHTEAKLATVERESAAKIAEYDELLAKRSARISTLEKQIKDIAYGTNQYAVASIDPTPDEEQVHGHVDLQRGENLVEVCIVQAKLAEPAAKMFGTLTPTTLFSYDFYDHESMVTPAREGLVPRFNDVSQYIVSNDDRFIEYLHHGRMKLEMYKTMGTKYEPLATGSVKLKPAIAESSLGPNRKITAMVELRGVDSPETVFAEVTYWIRFRLSLDGAIRAYRERQKAQDYLITERTLRNDETVVGNENTAIVTVTSCNGISARHSGSQPAAFVAYNFPGFPDVRTPTVTSSNNPIFDSVEECRVVMSANLHRCLETEAIEFMVFDDTDTDMESYIGMAVVPLAPLSRGLTISGAFQLISPEGKASGMITVHIAWDQPYVTPLSQASIDHVMAPTVIVGSSSAPTQVRTARGHAELVDGTDIDDGDVSEARATNDEAKHSEQVTMLEEVVPELVGTEASLIKEPVPVADIATKTEVAKAADIAAAEEAAKAKAAKEEAANARAVEEEAAKAKAAEEKANFAVETAAALQIQAGYRGHRDRKKAREMRRAELSKVSSNTSRRDINEQSPTARITIGAIRLGENAGEEIRRIRHRLFVHLNSSWLHHKYIGDEEEELMKLETRPVSSVPDDPHDWIKFNHIIRFPFNSTTAPCSDDSNDTFEFSIRGKKMTKALKHLAKEIARGNAAFLNFEVLHEPEPHEKLASIAPVAFVSISLKEQVWHKQTDIHERVFPLFDYAMWTGKEPQRLQVGEIRLSIEILQALLYRLQPSTQTHA